MYVQAGSLSKRPFRWPLMSPAWGVFGFVDSLRHHPSFPFICFVIPFLWEQGLNVRVRNCRNCIMHVRGKAAAKQ